ncbi:MAG: ATP-binding protein [Thermodesulfobacteriota bacterium]|nr:ATP-binding protein [Thermodesulfobacteriota bacterium]
MSANKTSTDLQIKKTILLPLACGMFFLLLISLATFWFLQNRQIDRAVAIELTEIDYLKKNIISHEKVQLESLFDYFQNDAAVQNFFLAKDRKGLLAATQLTYAKINSKYNITHCYFLTTDKKCFLRVHTPERHSDIIKRFTLDQTVRDNDTASGIELGPLGTFTLRVVKPWLINGKLAGYLELGREIEFLTEELQNAHKSHNIELVSLIAKVFINKDQWLNRQRMMQTGYDWDVLADHAIIHSTLKDIPKEIMPHPHESHEQHTNELFNIRIQDRAYRGGYICIKDAGGRDVGDIVGMIDVSEEQKDLLLLAFIMAISGLLVGGLLFYFFFRRIDGLEKRLTSNHNNLQNEIKERTVTENKLRQAREEWEKTFAAIPDIVCLLDKNMRILRTNEAACKTTNKTADQLVGRICHDLFRDSDSLPCPNCPMLKTLEDLQPHTAEISNSNLKKILLVTASPVLDDLGQLVSIVHVARDITALKKMEEQLRQSMKMEAIGRLAGGVAHDFNNLLTTILGYSELLIMDLDKDSPVLKSLKTIYEAGEKAAVLTHQLLAFSRKQDIELKAVDLDQVITQMGKMLTRVITEDIHLELRPHAGQRIIQADQGQLEQIIMNLVVNGSDSMPDGGRLTIETSPVVLDDEYAKKHEDVEPGPYVMLSVSDTGEGMAPEVMEKIFDPFFTTKELGKGTGLGLATVFGIIKQHNGHVHVYSEPGMGTTFKIYFPQVTSTLEKVVEQAPEPMPKGTENILIVDDEKDIVDLIATTLKPLGYKITTTTDPEEAVILHQETTEKFDLLLTDVIMPEMNGRQLAETLSTKQPGLKVIYMSGYTDDIIKRHSIMEQGFELIHKPLLPRALAEKLREVLDGSKRP